MRSCAGSEMASVDAVAVGDRAALGGHRFVGELLAGAPPGAGARVRPRGRAVRHGRPRAAGGRTVRRSPRCDAGRPPPGLAPGGRLTPLPAPGFAVGLRWRRTLRSRPRSTLPASRRRGFVAFARGRFRWRSSRSPGIRWGALRFARCRSLRRFAADARFAEPGDGRFRGARAHRRPDAPQSAAAARCRHRAGLGARK